MLWDGGYGKTLLPSFDHLPPVVIPAPGQLIQRLCCPPPHVDIVRPQRHQQPLQGAGWISMLRLESLLKQCNHPAQGLTCSAPDSSIESLSFSSSASAFSVQIASRAMRLSLLLQCS